jgi:hypothetical protein
VVTGDRRVDVTGDLEMTPKSSPSPWRLVTAVDRRVFRLGVWSRTAAAPDCFIRRVNSRLIQSGRQGDPSDCSKTSP